MTKLHDCHVIDWRIHGVHGTLIGERQHPAYNDHNNCTCARWWIAFGLHLITRLRAQQGIRTATPLRDAWPLETCRARHGQTARPVHAPPWP